MKFAANLNLNGHQFFLLTQYSVNNIEPKSDITMLKGNILDNNMNNKGSTINIAIGYAFFMFPRMRMSNTIRYECV